MVRFHDLRLTPQYSITAGKTFEDGTFEVRGYIFPMPLSGDFIIGLDRVRYKVVSSITTKDKEQNFEAILEPRGRND